MPAGVSWGQYMRFSTAAFLSMMAGAQCVHYYYKPLQDLDAYVERELARARQQELQVADGALKLAGGGA